VRAGAEGGRAGERPHGVAAPRAAAVGRQAVAGRRAVATRPVAVGGRAAVFAPVEAVVRQEVLRWVVRGEAMPEGAGPWAAEEPAGRADSREDRCADVREAVRTTP